MGKQPRRHQLSGDFHRGSLSIAAFLYVVALVLLLAGFAEFHRQNPATFEWLAEDNVGHLGAEHEAVARAMRQGRGFADPFVIETGPTAWVAPGLPSILAGLYWLFGNSRNAVADTVVMLQACVVAFTCLIVMHEAQRLRLAWLGVVLVPLMLLANYWRLFQSTHDSWLLLLMINLLWICVGQRWLRPTLRSSLVGGGLTGIALLCNPITGGVYGVLMAGTMLCRPRGNGGQNTVVDRLKRAVVVPLVASVVVGPWMIRNRVEFGLWIPIKSNAFFELWQSQVIDDDGLLDGTTQMHRQPWSSLKAREEYARVGEVEFIRQRKQRVLDAIAQDPTRYLRRVYRRGLGACLYYKLRLTESRDELSWSMVFKRMVFPLPFVALVLCLTLRPPPMVRWQFYVAASIYVLTLTPYVLISYSERYAMPLLGIKMLLVLHAGATIRQGVRRVDARNAANKGVEQEYTNDR